MTRLAFASSLKRRAREFLLGFKGPFRRTELAVLVLCPVLLLLTAWVTERQRLAGFVLPGVELDGVSLSGWSQPAVLSYLADREAELRARELVLRVKDADFRFRAEELGASLGAETLATEILNRGRQGGLFQRLAWRASRFGDPDAVSSRPSFDEDALRRNLEALGRAVLQTPSEGGLRFEGVDIVRVEPATGEEIDFDDTANALRSLLSTSEGQLVVVSLRTREPVTTKASVDFVEGEAQTWLKANIELLFELPEESTEEEPQSPEETLSKGDATKREDPRVRFTPKQIAKLLAVVQATSDPSRLELQCQPDALDEMLEPTRKRWERPAKDASFVVDNKLKITIEPSVVGTRLLREDVEKALREAAHDVTRTATVRIVEAEVPRITTKIARGLNIHQLVAQFTTHHPCCRPRVENIHHIADLVNGTVVLPGEVFSLNELVGPRSPANGFKEAPTIVHGEMKDTYGGGISQFTTTFFNAVLDGGYEIIERQPHSFYFPRYPLGHEATLSFPKPDFIFKNDTRSGLLVQAQYGPTFIRVKLFGDNEGRKTKRAVSRKFDWVDPPIEYVADEHVLPGEVKIRKRGTKGFSVDVSRTITFADGHKSEQARKVTYDPRPQVLRVHPCDIPKGEEGHTGEECPEPEEITLDGGVAPPASALPTPRPLSSF